MKRSLTDSGIHSVAPDVFNQSGHATLHVITPNYTTLDDKTLHYRRGVRRTLHDTILHYTMRHYTTLLQKRSLTDSVVHSVAVPDVFNQSGHVTVHFITPNYTTLHYTTLHYTTQHYTTLHYSSAEESAQRRAVFPSPPLNPQSYRDRGRLLCESQHLFSAQPMHKTCPTRPHTFPSHFNPFEYSPNSPDGQISGLKGARMRLQRVYCPVL